MKAHRTKALLTQVAAFGIAILLLGSTTTWAADMCFLDEEGLGVTVGKNFSFPGAGACKAFDGYLVGDGGCIVSGTACGTSDNVDIRFDLHYACTGTAFGAFGPSAFHIDRLNASLHFAGFGFYCRPNGFVNSTWSCAQFHVQTIPCPSAAPVD
jgi:hypothetical protein